MRAGGVGAGSSLDATQSFYRLLQGRRSRTLSGARARSGGRADFWLPCSSGPVRSCPEAPETALALDHALIGERLTRETIWDIDVGRLPADSEKKGYMKLVNLPLFIEDYEKKQR